MVRTVMMARHLHNVRSAEELLAKHEAALATARQRGVDVSRHDVREPVVAHVNHGRWIADCSCGSGVSVDLEMPGCCFDCGAVYWVMKFPEDFARIEHVLALRPRMENRNWVPGEDLAKLLLENELNGIGG